MSEKLSNNFENRELESLYKRAQDYAESVAGEKPSPDANSGEVAAYWDSYWYAYYSYGDSHIHENLSLEPGHDQEINEDSGWHEQEPEYNSDDSPSQDEFISDIKSLISLLEGTIGKPDIGRKEMFFRDPQARKEVFEFSKAIAEHIKDSNIKDLIIVDRSSRPLYIGVREYWQSKYPAEKMPGIYFINPKGFKSIDDLTKSQLREANLNAAIKGDSDESIGKARRRDEIIDEFKKIYAKLVTDKDQKVLVFDTCIHSGDSLYYAVDIMKDIGFSNIEIGAVNESDPRSKIQSNFHITNRRPENGCYPFDRDRIIEKTFEHVYSRRVDDAKKRAAGRALREEIKDIINEYLTPSQNI